MGLRRLGMLLGNIQVQLGHRPLDVHGGIQGDLRQFHLLLGNGGIKLGLVSFSLT